MVGWRHGIAGVLLAAFLASVAMPAFAQSNDRPVAGSVQRAGTFLAVMGAVPNSGVYEFPNSFLTLDDLLREAGGLTKDAGGTVRIVRNGRPAIQTHLSFAGRTQLLPGDVVLVDSHDRNKRSESPTVEVALVHLIDRPVVIHLRPGDADLQSLVRLLGQSPKVVANTRVLRSRRVAAQESPDQIPLTDGCVVVFPQKEINTARIRALPAPNRARGSVIRPTDASSVHLKAVPEVDKSKDGGKLSGPLFGPPNQPLPKPQRGPKVVDVAAMARAMLDEARTDLSAGRLEQARTKALAVKQLPFDSSSLKDGPDAILAEIDRRNKQQPPPIIGVPPRFPMDDMNGNDAGSRAKVAARANSPWNPDTPSEPGLPPLPPESETGKIAAAKPFPAAPDETTGEVAAKQTTDETVAEAAPVTVASDESTGSVDFVTLVIGIFAALGVLSAVAFLVSMGRKAASGSSPVARLLKRMPTRLDKLIGDDLEVCEEPMTMAATLEFFGRSPVVRSNRIDADHSTEPQKGPIFARRNKQHADHARTEREPAMNGVANDGPTAVRADAGQTVPPSPSRSTQHVLDRAVRRALQKESA